ncbi:hypothetical protein LLG96_12410 [bacterium]|nr:hypothetical protein [bacterium]
MKKHMVYAALLFGVCAVFLYGTGTCETSQSPTTIEISRLDFENADIRQVIKTLAEIGNRNIILDQDITGACTIFLKDITWESALLAVLNMKNLVGYEDNGYIKVLPREKYTLQINSLKEIQKKQSVEVKLAAPKKVRVIQIHHANAANVKTTIDQLLGDADKPSVDIRTNSLVFTASDSSLAVIEDIIKELDKETKQVSIEVRMVTVDSGFLSELGVNWSAVKNNNSASQNTVNVANQLIVGKYAGSISDVMLEATLASLIDKNKAEVISRPHITTQDNEQAILRSGQQIPLLSYDEARNVVLDMIDASTELQVTPHILTDDRILLDVMAARRKGEAVGTGVRITEEKADVKIITSNGETAVIGGLRQMSDTKSDTGIPILQNIPLVGQLFKYTKIENKKTDLVIFITPNIIERVKTESPQ